MYDRSTPLQRQLPPTPSRKSVVITVLTRIFVGLPAKLVRPGMPTWPVYRFLALLDAVLRRLPQPLGRAASGVSVEQIKIGEVAAEWLTPKNHRADAALLYLHGGGFVLGGGHTHRRFVSRLARAAGLPALLVDYRQLPTASLRTSVDDCLAAYRYLLSSGVDPARIVLAGDSAGGQLAMAIAAELRDGGEQAPAAVLAVSPWMDLACTTLTRPPRRLSDPYLSASFLRWVAQQQIKKFDVFETSMSASAPDLSKLPPTLIQVGEREVLLSDARTLGERLKDAGISCEVEIYPGQMHVFQVMAGIITEADIAVGRGAAFLTDCLETSAEKPITEAVSE